MVFIAVPVVVPYRLGDDAAMHPVQVDTLAADPGTAMADGCALAEAWVRIRHPGIAARVVSERIRAGSMLDQPPGLFLYVVARNAHIHSLLLPSRIDTDSGEELRQILDGLDAASVYGVIFDCRALTYINTSGLASIAANVRRLPMYVCHVSAAVRSVLEIIGMLSFVAIHADLRAALAAMLAANANPQPSNAVKAEPPSRTHAR